FAGKRRFLDKYHQRPSEATLFYWLDDGWGTGTKYQNWQDAMRGFVERIPGPRSILLRVEDPAQFRVARELEIRGLNIINQSVFMSHGRLDPEPSMPLTLLLFSKIKESIFDFTSNYKSPQGIMPAAQTYLIQLPNIFYFAQSAWDRKTSQLEDLTVL